MSYTWYFVCVRIIYTYIHTSNPRGHRQHTPTYLYPTVSPNTLRENRYMLRYTAVALHDTGYALLCVICFASQIVRYIHVISYFQALKWLDRLLFRSGFWLVLQSWYVSRQSVPQKTCDVTLLISTPPFSAYELFAFSYFFFVVRQFLTSS